MNWLVTPHPGNWAWIPLTKMPIEFGRVSENIYFGSCPENAADILTLRGLGVDAIHSLQTDTDLVLEGIDWSSIQKSYAENNITVLRTPIRDLDREDLRNRIEASVDALKVLIDAHRIVYVHCTVGWNRSATVVIAYLHWHQRLPLKQAVEQVLSCRNCGPSIEIILGIKR